MAKKSSAKFEIGDKVQFWLGFKKNIGVVSEIHDRGRDISYVIKVEGDKKSHTLPEASVTQPN